MAIPTVTTDIISAITDTTATGGGNATSDGGSAITAKGICWGTSINPTIALATKTNDGSGTGAFTSSLTGLEKNKLYYVRAYATNASGTAYGANVQFNATVTLLLYDVNVLWGFEFLEKPKLFDVDIHWGSDFLQKPKLFDVNIYWERADGDKIKIPRLFDVCISWERADQGAYINSINNTFFQFAGY